MKRLALLLLLSLPLSSGCATAVMSGAADGDNDYPTATADARITREVRTAIYRDPLLNDEAIRVSVDQGVVTLHGSVDNRMHVSRALQLARNIDGVRGVNIELIVRGTP